MACPPLRFVKAHALGNDFLLVRAEEVAARACSSLAAAICDRHTGIGADGLVLIADSSSSDGSIRIFNSDGSEATLSGNAIRCAAAWLLAEKAVSGPRVTLETRAGIRELHFLERHEANWIFRAEMGRPRFDAADVPFRPADASGSRTSPMVEVPLPVGDTSIHATIFSMGNPQCIVFVDDWAMVDWKALGADLERHPYFPDRTNVGFVLVVGENRIEVRFWERGAGHTLASGTGSCAAVVASSLAGKTGRQAIVVLERGEMEVHWREDQMVELVGPAEIIAEGEYLSDGQ